MTNFYHTPMFLTRTHIPLLRTHLTKFSNLCHTIMQNWLLQRMNLVHKLTSSLYVTFPQNNVYRGITVLYRFCLRSRFWIENILDRWKKSEHLRTMDTWMNSNVAAECRSEHIGKEYFDFNVQIWSLKLSTLLTYAVFADGTRVQLLETTTNPHNFFQNVFHVQRHILMQNHHYH